MSHSIFHRSGLLLALLALGTTACTEGTAPPPGKTASDTGGANAPELTDCGGGVHVEVGVDCPSNDTDTDTDTDEDTATDSGEPSDDCYVGEALDSDCDGLSDDFETNESGTEVGEADTDGDGLSDFDEITGGLGSDPLCYDTDGDGVNDGDEADASTDPTDPNDGEGGTPGIPNCLEGHGVDYTVDSDGDDLKLWQEALYSTSDDDSDSDDDTLPDGEEVVDHGTHPNDPDTDDDSVTDSVEVAIVCLDPLNPHSDGLAIDVDGDGVVDGDGIMDGEELTPTSFPYPSDPCTPHSDTDGLMDHIERAHDTDPKSNDTDGDSLDDPTEVASIGTGTCNETSPTDWDSDGDLVSDAIEVRLGSSLGACANDPAITPVYFDPTVSSSSTTWNGSQGPIASCASWSEVRSETFDSDYYQSRDLDPDDGGIECHCTFNVATQDPVDILGVEAWTPTSVHQAGSGDREGWVTSQVPAGVMLTTDWWGASQDVLSDGYSSHNGLSEDPSGTENWLAFGGWTDGTATSGNVNLANEVWLRVANGNLLREHIADCSELDHSATRDGLQFAITFRRDFHPTPPPGAVPPSDTTQCQQTDVDHTRIALLPLGTGSAAPFPLRGDRKTSGALLTEVRVKHWAGADAIAIVGPDDERVELRPGGPGATPVPAGWRWADVRWYAWSEDGEPVGVPEVRTQSACGGPIGVEPGVAWGYKASLQDLEQLAIASGLQLTQLLPNATVDDHPSVRLRLMRPKAFTGRPGQARLRLELASGHTLGMVRLNPVVTADDIRTVEPLQVSTWSFKIPTPAGVFRGTLETLPDRLVVHVVGANQEGNAAGEPLTLTLPAEVAP